MIQGTWVKSAVLSINTTTLFPLSTILPKVGHWLTVKDADSGVNAYCSSPAVANDDAKDVGGRLSILTMISEITSFGLADTQEATCWRYEVREPPSWIAHEV